MILMRKSTCKSSQPNLKCDLGAVLNMPLENYLGTQTFSHFQDLSSWNILKIREKIVRKFLQKFPLNQNLTRNPNLELFFQPSFCKMVEKIIHLEIHKFRWPLKFPGFIINEFFWPLFTNFSGKIIADSDSSSNLGLQRILTKIIWQFFRGFSLNKKDVNNVFSF